MGIDHVAVTCMTQSSKSLETNWMWFLLMLLFISGDLYTKSHPGQNIQQQVLCVLSKQQFCILLLQCKYESHGDQLWWRTLGFVLSMIDFQFRPNSRIYGLERGDSKTSFKGVFTGKRISVAHWNPFGSDCWCRPWLGLLEWDAIRVR